VGFWLVGGNRSPLFYKMHYVKIATGTGLIEKNTFIRHLSAKSLLYPPLVFILPDNIL